MPKVARNKTYIYILQQCPTEIRYRPKVSAETIGIGIGFGAETFSAVTEIALYCIFLEFVHFKGFNRVANKKKMREKKVGREKKSKHL